MTPADLIMGRRSIRVFTEQAVSEATIKEIVTEASFAPSWKNTQITRYIAVSGELKDRIATECCTAYAKNGLIIQGAPVLMVITYIKNRSGFERDGSFSTNKKGGWQMFDAGIATQTLCLAAHEHGLGTVIQGIFDDEKVASILNIPDDREVVCLVSMGYPAEAPDAPKRKSIDELLEFK